MFILSPTGMSALLPPYDVKIPCSPALIPRPPPDVKAKPLQADGQVLNKPNKSPVKPPAQPPPSSKLKKNEAKSNSPSDTSEQGERQVETTLEAKSASTEAVLPAATNSPAPSAPSGSSESAFETDPAPAVPVRPPRRKERSQAQAK